MSRIQVSEIRITEDLEGPGRRFCVWTQGCSIRCLGCCNPHMLPFFGGISYEIGELFSLLEQKNCQESKNNHKIEGISVLGGEPLDQGDAVLEFCVAVKKSGFSVVLFSGYEFSHIQKQSFFPVLQSCVDVLISGPFLQSQLCFDRRWIGSKNQELHFFSDFYTLKDPGFSAPNTVEITFKNGELEILGFPLCPKKILGS